MRGLYFKLISVGLGTIVVIMTRYGSDEAYAWLKHYECSGNDPDYTHTSMFGGRDWSTCSGKLKFPDTASSSRRMDIGRGGDAFSDADQRKCAPFSELITLCEYMSIAAEAPRGHSSIRCRYSW